MRNAPKRGAQRFANDEPRAKLGSFTGREFLGVGAMGGGKNSKSGGKVGGARPGAGRPKGSKSPLPYGYRKAVKAMKLRIPPDATPEQEELAGRALQRMIDVMEGKTYRHSGEILSASRALREEICGSPKREVNVTSRVTLEELVKQSYKPEGEDSGNGTSGDS